MGCRSGEEGAVGRSTTFSPYSARMFFIAVWWKDALSYHRM